MKKKTLSIITLVLFVLNSVIAQPASQITAPRAVPVARVPDSIVGILPVFEPITSTTIHFLAVFKLDSLLRGRVKNTTFTGIGGTPSRTGDNLNIPACSDGTVKSVGIDPGTDFVGGTAVTVAGNIPLSLSTTGIPAGTYNGRFTVDAKGRLTWAAKIVPNFNITRPLETVAAAANGFRIDTVRDALVHYSVTIVSTATISGAASGYIVLETCPTNSAVSNDWYEVGRVPNGQSVALAVTLQAISTGGGQVSGVIPGGWYARIRIVNLSGTPVYTATKGQEVLW